MDISIDRTVLITLTDKEAHLLQAVLSMLQNESLVGAPEDVLRFSEELFFQLKDKNGQ